MNKEELRQQMKNYRKNLLPDFVTESRKKIEENIWKVIEDTKAKVILCYYPMNKEAGIFPEQLLGDNRIILVPKIKGLELDIIQVTETTKYIKSLYGTMEPESGEIWNDIIDLALIPALAVSKEGKRIGMGKGFYDRLLGLLKIKKTYAVVYEAQITESVPEDPWDKSVEDVITEMGIF